jgi:hypothetical protein
VVDFEVASRTVIAKEGADDSVAVAPAAVAGCWVLMKEKQTFAKFVAQNE